MLDRKYFPLFLCVFYCNSFCTNERIGERSEDGRGSRGERDAQEGVVGR